MINLAIIVVLAALPLASKEISSMTTSSPVGIVLKVHEFWPLFEEEEETVQESK